MDVAAVLFICVVVVSRLLVFGVVVAGPLESTNIAVGLVDGVIDDGPIESKIDDGPVDDTIDA